MKLVCSFVIHVHLERQSTGPSIWLEKNQWIKRPTMFSHEGTLSLYGFSIINYLHENNSLHSTIPCPLSSPSAASWPPSPARPHLPVSAGAAHWCAHCHRHPGKSRLQAAETYPGFRLLLKVRLAHPHAAGKTLLQSWHAFSGQGVKRQRQHLGREL